MKKRLWKRHVYGAVDLVHLQGLYANIITDRIPYSDTVWLVHHQGLDSRLRARSGRALEAHWASIHFPPFDPLINKEATLWVALALHPNFDTRDDCSKRVQLGGANRVRRMMKKLTADRERIAGCTRTGCNFSMQMH